MQKGREEPEKYLSSRDTEGLEGDGFVLSPAEPPAMVWEQPRSCWHPAGVGSGCWVCGACGVLPL